MTASTDKYQEDNFKLYGRVRPTFSGTVTTPATSTIDEQDENTLYAFSYYQITGQDRNCSCYVCADLAAFKPKSKSEESLSS